MQKENLIQVLNYVDMLIMFLVSCLIYMVILFPVYNIGTTLDSLVNKKTSYE